MRIAFLLIALAGSAAAQTPADTTNLPPKTEPFEVGLFRSVYDIESPILVVPLQLVNESAYPVYFGAAPALWIGTAVSGADLDPALRLTAAQGLNFGVTFALKNLIRRPRPYISLEGVDARDRGHQGDKVFDPHSFPSGHTSSAFVIATSLSLSYPEWYVVVPAAVWASAMGVSRVYHGVHYPSDVVVGAAIGVASGAAAHFLMPDVFGSDGEGTAVPVRIVIPL